MRQEISQGRKAVLVDGCRIPFLRSGTAYRDLTPYDLGRLALKALLTRTMIEPAKVGQVIMGTVISRLATSNVARESARGGGLPHSNPGLYRHHGLHLRQCGDHDGCRPYPDRPGRRGRGPGERRACPTSPFPTENP